MRADDESTRLERAWEALEAGGREAPQRALALARTLSEARAETWTVRAAAHLEAGDWARAQADLQRAEALGAGDDPGALWVRGELSLAQWNVPAAERAWTRLVELDGGVDALLRLALVRDLQGRWSDAERLCAEAARLDPVGAARPPRLSAREMERAVDEAARALPRPFAEALDDVAVLIDPMPGPELAADDPLEVPPDVLGLFVGASRLERSDEDPLSDVARIYLFQRNLERGARDRAELVEQVRVTLYHELGHYLGFDEDGLADIGLE